MRRPARVMPEILCVTLDGVMARTGEAMLEAIRATCASYRLKADPNRIMLGFPIRSLLRTLAHDQHGDLLGSELDHASIAFEKNYISNIRRLGPSLVDTHIIGIIEDVRNQIEGIKIALVSPHLHNLAAVANTLGIAGVFDKIIPTPHDLAQNGHRIARGTNVYEHAIELPSLRAENCIGIARCPYDIACMRDIGMCSIGIKMDINSGEVLNSAGVWRIFASVEAMTAFKIIDTFHAGPPVRGARDRRIVFHINEKMCEDD